MSRILWAGDVGTDGKLPVEAIGTDRAPFILARLVASITAMRVPGAKIPAPLGFIVFPQRPRALPGFGMGPRNQARWLPAHCPEGRVG
jgi:hypothetical protein